MLERILAAALTSACLTFVVVSSTLYMIVRGLFGAVGDGGMGFIICISLLAFIGFLPGCYRQTKTQSDFSPMKRVRDEMHLDELREGYEVILRPKNHGVPSLGRKSTRVIGLRKDR